MGTIRGGVRTNEFGAFFDSIAAGDRAIYGPIMDAVLSLLGNGAPGVVSDLLDELEVSPVTPPANSILIAAGAALLGASGAHVFTLTEELTLTVPAAAVGNSRIDRIGVRLDGRAASPDNREITIARIAGAEAASNPVVPAITDAQDDERYFFDLAHVTVDGVDAIDAANVSDERTYRGGLALSDAVPEDVSGAAATAGTGATASRDTHGHAVSTGDPVDVGTANDPGSGSALALANHGHNVPTGLRGISADSPAFTGTPTTPDPPAAANTQQLANARWVRARIADLVASAPGALDTLNELAAALDDDPNFATTITAEIALRARLASPAFTGTPTAPDAPSGANTQQLANARWVRARIADLVASAPAMLDTLNELAAALGDDPNFATVVLADIALRATEADLTALEATVGTLPVITKYQYALGSSGSMNTSTDLFDDDDLLIISAWVSGGSSFNYLAGQFRFGDLPTSGDDAEIPTVNGNSAIDITRNAAGNLRWRPATGGAADSYLYVTKTPGAFS